jgi:ATP-dependent Clp protease ATP-binding subunit ClpA
LQMKEIQSRLQENGLQVRLTVKAQEWLASIGYDAAFGARPLRRALQKYIESPLSVRLLSGEFTGNDTVEADVDENQQIVFRKVDAVPVETNSEVEQSV